MGPTKFHANWTTQLRKGVLELVVMRALSNSDSYGYALIEAIKTECGLEITDGTLYAIFVRLKQEQLIEPYWQEQDKGPSRKYYKLTPVGQQALAGMDAIWNETIEAIDGARNIGRPL